jgi:hypothetical protein
MPLTENIRNEIFQKLKKGLEGCCPPMVNSKKSKDAYEIIGNKPVPYGYKKEIVPGMFFASIVARKDMVSFYFFPCYEHIDDFKNTAPELFKSLKGKTCFNFKKSEQVNEKELAALLKKGVQVWKKAGYIQ